MKGLRVRRYRRRAPQPPIGPITDARELYETLKAKDIEDAEVIVGIPHQGMPKRGRAKWALRRHKCWSSVCYRVRQGFELDGEFRRTQRGYLPDLAKGLVVSPVKAAVTRLKHASTGGCFCAHRGYEGEGAEDLLDDLLSPPLTLAILDTEDLGRALSTTDNTGIYFLPHRAAEPIPVAVEVDDPFPDLLPAKIHVTVLPEVLRLVIAG